MIEPTTDKVFIKRLNIPRAHGSILAPDIAVKLSQEGIVVAKGPGDHDKKGRLQPLDVEVGDRVIFAVHAAKPVDIEGSELWTLRERDIIAVIEP